MLTSVTNKTDQRFYTGWVLVEYDGDAEEMVWVAQCLDFDIVAAGRTVREAIDSVRDCVGVALCDDLNNGMDPYGRNKAPADQWDRLWRVVNNGEPVKISELSEATRLLLASQIVVGIVEVREDDRDHDVVSDIMTPTDPDRLNSYLCQQAA